MLLLCRHIKMLFSKRCSPLKSNAFRHTKAPIWTPCCRFAGPKMGRSRTMVSAVKCRLNNSAECRQASRNTGPKKYSFRVDGYGCRLKTQCRLKISNVRDWTPCCKPAKPGNYHAATLQNPEISAIVSLSTTWPIIGCERRSDVLAFCNFQ
jgi:hypothetical protein